MSRLVGVVPDRSCGLCGNESLMVRHSRAMRRGIGRINPWFDPNERTCAVCTACGARQELEDQQPS